MSTLISDVDTHDGDHSYQSHVAPVYCDLFGDRVAEQVCHLLKNEQNAWWRCDLLCSGCYRRWLR